MPGQDAGGRMLDQAALVASEVDGASTTFEFGALTFKNFTTIGDQLRRILANVDVVIDETRYPGASRTAVLPCVGVVGCFAAWAHSTRVGPAMSPPGQQQGLAQVGLAHTHGPDLLLPTLRCRTHHRHRPCRQAQRGPDPERLPGDLPLDLCRHPQPQVPQVGPEWGRPQCW